MNVLYAPFTRPRAFLTPSLRARPHHVHMDKIRPLRFAGTVACLALVALVVALVKLFAMAAANPGVASTLARALAFPG
jgi:hypothetical protein